jgi:cytochrome b subunit of formate dehydrogenase
MSDTAQASSNKEYVRFDLLQRIQHFIFLISFSLLGLTGLPQKYPLSPISIGFFNLVGGIEVARAIHHTSAIVMMIVSLVHVLEVLYRIMVLRNPINMIPWISDALHVYEDVMYYIGRRNHKGYYGRYSYAEKAEYLALIWGTIVMGLTGFMMWNPILTVSYLPGESIPAAKAAHGGEAVLAVLAIIIWHFYHVHIKMLNLSMFTGKLSRHEMQHEHPAELAAIDAGHHERAPIPPAVLRKRQMIYAPIAIAILAAFGYGFYFFVGYETTAVVTSPRGETVPVFATLPPTPSPTPAPTSTPSAASAALTWDGYVGQVLQQKCTTCHGAAAMAGVNFTTYVDAMKVITAGDSANSKLVIKQSAGGHPGQLSDDELAKIKEWIDAGAPEK